jgi:hypothetical protein
MKRNFKKYFSQIIFLVLALPACQTLEKPGKITLFEKLDPAITKVDFTNQLDYKEEFNIYRYRNFYNGGGVALGDINNDSLIDIYFTSNMHGNRLYLNKGNFVFEDITEKAGVKGNKAWSTGVSMADINGDGWLDIYVCNSGDVKGGNRENELFINNGNLTFAESAAKYGIADKGFSTHAAFFDYDKDGDLDLYLLNNSYQAIGSFDLTKNLRNTRDSIGGHKFYRNDGDHFVDISEKAGIYGSIISFGLGVTVGDVNNDGWQDIYVSNDFFERDYLYINNHDGTFSERLEEMMRSISAASMGADMADINNDRYPEIFVTEMLPEHEDRLKTKTTFDSYNRYLSNIQNGYYHQFTRNMLHLNNADGTFSEIGRISNVYATDWSWGALIFDMDNDGLKDIFVANGIYQDLTDQDYIQYFSNVRVMRMIVMDKNVDYKKLIESIPSQKLSNYAFHNNGDLNFNNKAADWGLDEPSHSNGSAYGDLDNDGDLDLVVNNVNMTAFIFRNQSMERNPSNHYLKFILTGEGKNTEAIGAKITVINKGETRYIEQMPMRGFESTVDPRPNLGLGNLLKVDSVVVEWPNEKISILKDIQTNQTLRLSQSDGKSMKDPFYSLPLARPLFKELPASGIIDYRHVENTFNDFERDFLLFQMVSTEGPRIAKGDVNGDGLDDIYIGGAKDSPGSLFVQTGDGKFQSVDKALFETDKASEDTDAAFFDADNDGDLDLYVCSGGYELPSSSTALISRLYLNNGKGKFTKSQQILPAGEFVSSSCVRPADFDNDGVSELFIGVRLKPFQYGIPTDSYLLENDGKGNFKDITGKAAPDLKGIGMVKDMQWCDIDGDKDLDMIIIGEWMPVTILINEGGVFRNNTKNAGLDSTDGWWNRIQVGDFDNDGDIDFVAGNHGWNSRFKASPSKPVTMYVSDFDLNGSVEQIICTYNGDTSYPMALKHDMVTQLPYLKKKYPTYGDFKKQTITDIFTPKQLENASELKACQLSTSVFINDGKGHFTVKPLSFEAQLSPVFGIDVEDFNNDGNLDIAIGGNLYSVKPEVGRYDASYGLILIGNGDGTFKPVQPRLSGMRLVDEVRDIIGLKTKKGKILVVARNNNTLQLFGY